MSSQEKIITEFRASLPPVTSAIQYDGQGDGGQVKIAFSKTENFSVMKMHALGGRTFVVRILKK